MLQRNQSAQRATTQPLDGGIIELPPILIMIAHMITGPRALTQGMMALPIILIMARLNHIMITGVQPSLPITIMVQQPINTMIMVQLDVGGMAAIVIGMETATAPTGVTATDVLIALHLIMAG